MDKKTKFYYILGAVVTVGAIMTVCYFAGHENSKPVLIGHVSPLTGDNAYIGYDQLRGAEMAVEDLNRNGGILGRRVELVVEDDQGSSTIAVNVAHKLCLNKNIVGVIGHLNSSCSMSAAPIYKRHNLPMITPVSTSDKLTTTGLDNIFRVCIRNSDQAPALVEYCINKGFRKYGIIHDNGDYGKDLADQLKKLLAEKKSDAHVVSEEVISANNTDYRSILTKMKTKDPDVIFVGAMAREASLLMIQSKEIGLDAIFVGGDGMFSDELVRRGGDAVEGTIVSHIAPMQGGSIYSQEFFSRYISKYNEKVRAYAPLAYDCVMVLAEAIESAGTLDKETIRDVLHRKEYVHSGISGKISFDQTGERLERKPYLYEIQKGQFMQIGVERE